MDFDLTQEQKEIKDVARELLAARSPWAKVREAAERPRLRRGAVARARRARAGPASPSARSTAGRASAPWSSRCCSRSSDTRARRRRCSRPPTAASIIQACGTDEQRSRAAARARRGRGDRRDRQRASCARTPRARPCSCCSTATRPSSWTGAEVEALDVIDSTRRYATVRGGEGRAARAGRGGPRPRGGGGRGRRRLPAVARHDRRLRQGPQAVRRPGRAPSRPSRTVARRCC